MKITLNIKPKPKGRANGVLMLRKNYLAAVVYFVTRGKFDYKAIKDFVHKVAFVQIYTPASTANYEKEIAFLVKAFMTENKLEKFSDDTPILMDVIFHMPMPKSWSKKKKEMVCGQFNRQKPDASNLLKAVEDALNGVVYHDDSQIVQVRVTKEWSFEGAMELLFVNADDVGYFEHLRELNNEKI